MRWASLLLGAIVGVLLFVAARFFFLPPPPSVHYHANFALFVDGQRVDLSGDHYMEDVTACAGDPAGIRPQDRAHLHNHEADVVHVHHNAATWSALFTNLGFGLGDDYLILDDGRRFFSGEEGRSVKFFLNGEQVLEMANRTIRSEDRVLVSVGTETPEQALATQYATVASTAGEYNTRQDPAGCAGNMRQLTVRERLQRAIWAP
jgi:hypothetical protein